MTSRPPSHLGVALLAACMTLAACGGGRPPRQGGALVPVTADARQDQAVGFYHSMGLAAASAPVPFVGAAAHFATTRPDTSLSLVTLAIPNRSLTFAREGDRYRAQYAVDLRVIRDGAEIQRVEALEVVRVASFREIGRGDESVIFQRWLRLAPGRHVVRLTVRDVVSGRNSGDTLSVTVPRFDPARPSVSSPLPVYEARARPMLDSIPSLVARPRATAIFGRDSVVLIYMEGYAATSAPRLPISLSVRNDAGSVVWADTASLTRTGSLFSGIMRIPIARVGVGVGFVSVVASGSVDTVRTPYFLSFGEDLPVAPFEEMLSYLRFFASGQTLRRLREAAPEARAQMWSDFLRATDPVPTTAEHEALQAYFARIQLADSRFREELPSGWLSDRGSVFVALGEPDNVYEQTVTSSGGRRLASPVRIQVWEYRQHRVQITFTDEQHTGRYKFGPRSEAEFRALLQRLLSR
ncbi:MAG TPA: GWxTD domain-containing protein [Gemmatimonadaceae bacterium]